MPPVARPLSHRELVPRSQPGLVMKSTLLDEAALLVLHRDDHRVRLEMSLPPPVPGRRVFGLRRIADERAVQIAVLIDLRAAHEADVDVASLQQQQHLSAPENHVGARGAALIVGRRRQLARLDERADHAALEQDREPGAAQALRQRRREQRNAHAGKHHLAVPELPRAQNRAGRRRDGQVAGTIGDSLRIVDRPSRARRATQLVDADQLEEFRP